MFKYGESRLELTAVKYAMVVDSEDTLFKQMRSLTDGGTSQTKARNVELWWLCILGIVPTVSHKCNVSRSALCMLRLIGQVDEVVFDKG
jgi:hypothetical protein